VTLHLSKFRSFSDLSRHDERIKELRNHAASEVSFGNLLVLEISLILLRHGTS
jgi:hypothetical protein